MSNQLNVSVLVAAREEYSEQLKRHLVPLMHEGFTSIYEDAEAEDGDNVLVQFQIFLKQIPKWNQTILEEETKRIREKCPFLMDLVTAIFVSHVKILASVRIGGNHKNIRIKIPTAEVFLHSVYVNAAESFYYDPFVFENTERKNTEKIKSVIEEAIEDTISSMIPIQSILQEYLSTTFNDHIKSEPPPLSSFSNDTEMPVEKEISGNDIADDLFPEIAEPPSNEFGESTPLIPIGDDPPFMDKMTSDIDKINDNVDSSELVNPEYDPDVPSDPYRHTSISHDNPSEEVIKSDIATKLGDEQTIDIPDPPSNPDPISTSLIEDKPLDHAESNLFKEESIEGSVGSADLMSLGSGGDSSGDFKFFGDDDSLP